MEALRVHAPWLKAALVKVPVTLGFLLCMHWLLTGAHPELSWQPIVFPIVYLHAFKYWYHKYPMHRKAPVWFPAFLALAWIKVKKSHDAHHVALYDATYRTREPARLKEIISDWYIFPVLLALHYVLALALFGCFHALGLPVWSWADVRLYFWAFVSALLIVLMLLEAAQIKWDQYHFLGMVSPIAACGVLGIMAWSWGELATAFVALSIWFGLFEAVHWFAHVQDTWLDRVMSRTWLIGWWWVYTVEYHREHHDRPRGNFHFLPPWLLDWIFNTGISPRIYREASGEYRARPSAKPPLPK
jgi:hypothetical protein